MYAIVEIAGQQFKVEENGKVFVHRLKGDIGDVMNFDNVFLIGDDDDTVVGTPKIPGAVVTAKILEHLKGDKVLVFKKKRRKGYQKMNGHRQLLTRIQIENIFPDGTGSSEVAPVSGEQVTMKDNLTKIEGIGPKIEELLNKAGISTFADLAAAQTDRLKEILEEGGSRFGMRNPSSWPGQSELAAAGKWDELKDLQSKLKGGVE